MKQAIVIFAVLSGLLFAACANNYNWEILLDEYEATLDEFQDKLEDGETDNSLKYRLDNLKQQIDEIMIKLEKEDPEEYERYLQEYDRRFG